MPQEMVRAHWNNRASSERSIQQQQQQQQQNVHTKHQKQEISNTPDSVHHDGIRIGHWRCIMLCFSLLFILFFVCVIFGAWSRLYSAMVEMKRDPGLETSQQNHISLKSTMHRCGQSIFGPKITERSERGYGDREKRQKWRKKTIQNTLTQIQIIMHLALRHFKKKIMIIHYYIGLCLEAR